MTLLPRNTCGEHPLCDQACTQPVKQESTAHTGCPSKKMMLKAVGTRSRGVMSLPLQPKSRTPFSGVPARVERVLGVVLTYCVFFFRAELYIESLLRVSLEPPGPAS